MTPNGPDVHGLPTQWFAVYLLLMGLAVSVPALAVSPAFDCTSAEGEVEQLICSDDELASMDLLLAKTYSQAIQNIPKEERDTFRAEQRGWIKGRNDCWKANNVRRCVEFSYQSKTVELQIIGGLVEAPEYQALSCADSADSLPFTLSVYQKTKPSAAVLTRGNDQVIAIKTAGGAANRYLAPNVSLLLGEGQVEVDWFGEQVKCTLSE